MSSLPSFHPLVRDWFAERFGEPSAPQRAGWPAIASGEHTLILAPTGTGKTLAAFLWEVDQLIVRGSETPLPNAVQILYVSPLKALSNDIHRNLEQPLAELRARAQARGLPFPEIRVAVRTGDTPAAARARMTRKAPHILITTPESLHIMLTTVRGRGMFSLVRAIIVDEIHAVAGTKRGAHLALTLERLVARCERPPQRIGLSATQRPLDEIARFLGGCASRAADVEPAFRPVTVVDCGLVKRMELAVVSPPDAPPGDHGSVWPRIAELALRYVRGARTTLIFVNNRGQAERMAARINTLAGEEVARPYHGSLARERRLSLERALKAGELRALVTTSSLELGIDIGSVNLVLQLQSPKRVASGLQRVGRAGHALGAASRGVFVPTHRDDLVEMLAVVEGMRDGAVEPTRAPQNALDVLAQVLVAMASVDDWAAGDAYSLVRCAYPYHRLGRGAFDEVLAMLAGKYPSDIVEELQPRLTWDRMTDRISGTRASRMVAVISGGTIPDRGLYAAVLPDRTRLGELDEEFVHESRVGDVFQLGSATWRIAAIERDRVIVAPAPGAPARMPFWHGEYSTRAVELAPRVGALRREAAAVDHHDGPAVEALAQRLGCDPAAARTLCAYVAEQRAVTGVVPDERTLVLEEFRDEVGSVRVVIHSVFGGRVNAPWGMAVAQRVREALGGAACQVQTTDDGILLRLPELGMATPLHAVLGMGAAEAERRVLDEVGDTSMFGARFRMNAARALLLPRGAPRRRMPLWLQRLKAQDLLQAVRAHPTFPILVETYREVLQDAFDLAALGDVMRALADGRIAVHTVRTDRPSPFAAGLQLAFVMDWLYADDTPQAERRAAMLAVDRGLLYEVMGADGADDDTARALAELVAARRGEVSGRRARTADELAHLLERAGDLTLDELHARTAAEGIAPEHDPVAVLLASGRALEIRIPAGDGTAAWRVIPADGWARWAAALGPEQVARVRAGATLDERDAAAVLPDHLRAVALEPRAARREILARYVSQAGPVTVSEIRARLPWSVAWVEAQLARWERTGRLVRGRFRADVHEPEWCQRSLVERARRRVLARLRREIRPVTLPAYAAFLQRWQHVDPRDRLRGAAGLEVVLHQLGGVARPTDAWEIDYLPSRIDGYDPAWLSTLAASGEIAWSGQGRSDGESGALMLAGVRFFARGEGALWTAPDADAPVAGDAARAVRDTLARQGASFIADLEAATGLTPAAMRDTLRELVAAGLVTNDTAEGMREVSRTRALPARDGAVVEDATRWLPADFAPSTRRPVVQRRMNRRRLPRWRRPDLPGPRAGWVGRWSLLRGAGAGSALGAAPDEEVHAEAVARRWLERYGVVTRDWWRRERPPVSWRAIYRELRRLEYRGEVRRGWFVEGLAGAQFASPDAVEMLRALRDGDPEAPLVVLAARDPCNPYQLALAAMTRERLTHPRGADALLVMRAGRVLLSAEARGSRVFTSSTATDADIAAAARALAEYLKRTRGRRGRCTVVQVDDVPAMASARLEALRAAGFRRGAKGLEYLPASAT